MILMIYPKFGDAGSVVTDYQKALKSKGFSPGTIDGIFGGKTRAASSAFQKSIGLKGSGLPGPMTMKALAIEALPEIGLETEIPHVKVKSTRNLLPALESLIDKQVEKKYLPEFQTALKTKNYGQLIIICCKAMDDLKIREATNNNDGYIVEMIQKICGGKRGYAWCMYAVNVAIAWVECKTGKVSKMPASGSCANTRNDTSGNLIISSADSEMGDVWIWKYSSGNGHTGVFEKWGKKLSTAWLYEGNTTKGIGSDGKINREGGGFYHTNRAYKISGMTLAMVIRPFT